MCSQGFCWIRVDFRVVENLILLDPLYVDDLDFMEHREGIEPSNTGFADQRVSHFATGAHLIALWAVSPARLPRRDFATCPGWQDLSWTDTRFLP
jgi:hypothetical protein